jgi:hypothetical protein
MERHPQAVATIAAWAESLGYDAAIWTALTSNFDEWGKGGEPFSVSAALQYLETLEGEDPAKLRRRWSTFGKRRPRSRRPCARRSLSAGLGDGIISAEANHRIPGSLRSAPD